MYPTYLLSVATETPAAISADFDEWYTSVHLPEIIALPGFLSGARYHRLSRNEVFPSSGPTFLAQYGFESLDDLISEPFRAVRGFGPFAGRVTSNPAVFRLVAQRDGGTVR